MHSTPRIAVPSTQGNSSGKLSRLHDDQLAAVHRLVVSQFDFLPLDASPRGRSVRGVVSATQEAEVAVFVRFTNAEFEPGGTPNPDIFINPEYVRVVHRDLRSGTIIQMKGQRILVQEDADQVVKGLANA